MSETQNHNWLGRSDLLYYQVVRLLVSGLSKRATSMLDVGSGGIPYLSWFDHVADRASLDLRRPLVADGVRSITADICRWVPDKQYDVVTCLQVLEHIPKASIAARKLLKIGKTVIVSVPYCWPDGHTAGHVHDPVDEQKLSEWFGREPNFSYHCREIASWPQRLICVYEENPEPWTDLNDRAAKRAARSAARQAAAKTKLEFVKIAPKRSRKPSRRRAE